MFQDWDPSCVTDDFWSVQPQAKQRLNEWCSSFAATAIMIITIFLIQDTDFHDIEQREDFATTMLNWNCYLFSENEDTDYKVNLKYCQFLA